MWKEVLICHIRIQKMMRSIRIFAEPFAINFVSCRLLEKSGFVYEGMLRKNAVKNGVVLDMKIYSIIRRSRNYVFEEIFLGYSN